VGGVEQEADLLAEVDELEAAAFPARGDIEAGEGAETHAVHADQIGEVEDDALVIRQQRPDLVIEYVADTGHKFAVQSNDDGVRVAIDVQRQGGRGVVGVVGHGQFIVMASSLLSLGINNLWMGTECIEELSIGKLAVDQLVAKRR
jgi:hypothetical protein